MPRVVKSVSFNQDDPFEIEMYQYTKKFPNFSSFIKRLIQNSMNNKKESFEMVPPVQEKISTCQVQINPEFLKQLI